MATLTTVTPVYAGEKYLEGLITRIAEIREAGGFGELEHIESIFVIDGAIDDSESVLRRLEKQYDWVVVVELARNFGQHAATACGLAAAKGDWVVTLDEDLQHPPDLIVELFEKANQDDLLLVYGNPAGRQLGFLRDLASRMAKWIVSLSSRELNIRQFSSFRLVEGGVARAAGNAFSVDMYLDVIFSWFTDRMGSVSLDLTDERINEAGSSYNLLKLLRHFRRMVMSSDLRIIRMFSGIGLLAVVAALGFFGMILVAKFAFPDSITVHGWISTIAAIVFVGGVIILQVSVALEVLCAILNNVRGKPASYRVGRSNRDN